MCTFPSLFRGRGVVYFGLAVLMAGAASGQPFHSADTTADFEISLPELLRTIQLFNSPGLSCLEGSEDGYTPGPGDRTCKPYDADYNPQDWKITLTELLRMIQFFNARVYGVGQGTEDAFVPIFDPEPPSDPAGELDELIMFTGNVPGDIVAPETQEILIGLLLPAVQKVRAFDYCGAAADLDSYLSKAQEVRGDGSVKPATGPPKTVKAGSKSLVVPDLTGFAEISFALGHRIQFDILTQSPGPPECPGFERVGMKAEADVMEEGTQMLKLGFYFGAPKLQPIGPPPEDGSVYTEVELPGLELHSGEPGEPGIPSTRHLVGIPPGAFVSSEVGTGRFQTIHMKLHPFQGQPVDQAIDEDPDPDPLDLVPPHPAVFANPPFVRNAKRYATNEFYPPNPCVITPVGTFRGLDLVQVEVFGGQYNPVTAELRLFENVQCDLFFSNGPDGFVRDWSTGPFESDASVYIGAVLNSRSVLESAPVITLPPNIIGEELLILTHPNFRAAADMLAAWKNEKGIVTNVFECGTGSGIAGRQSNTEIDAFIEARYASTAVKASYILLMGDAEFIAPFYQLGVGTDWPYAVIPTVGVPDPLVPTFALGRIPVDTLAQATTVVEKIIKYEKEPPGSPVTLDPFYSNATIASQFQCCRTDVANPGTAQRTFAQVSEFSRNVLVSNGYTVQRIYQETVDPDYGGDPTPRRYYDGTLLPAAIGPGSGFSWNGTRAQVISAFNAGRFLILHRDHGWHSGWGHPPFDSNDVQVSLNNGDFLPVVFSINCSSGLFDNETAGGAEGSTVGGVYFAERLLRKANGGAVGIIGDTRVSPSWPNSALTRGLFDAIWPNAIPGFGSNTSKRRLGDILNHAKLYLWTQVGVAGQGTSLDDFKKELRLYHVIGDPTLEIWTKDPRSLVLSGAFQIAVFNPQTNILVIDYPTEDVVITAYQLVPPVAAPGEPEPVPLGRAKVVQGTAVLDLVNPPNRQYPVQFAANLPEALGGAGSAALPQ